MAQGAEDFGVRPARVHRVEGLRIGWFESAGNARGCHQERAHAGDLEVHARCGSADRAIALRNLEIRGERGIGRIGRASFAVPCKQRRGGPRQDVGDGRVFDAAHQHVADRQNEGDREEHEQRQHEQERHAPRPHARAHEMRLQLTGCNRCCPHVPTYPYLASQALQRWFSSSWWSAHHWKSIWIALAAFSGAFGICGRMSTPESALLPTSGSDERRAGP